MSEDDAWQRYLAAAQRLDAVRRGTALLADERELALTVVREDLAEIGDRLAAQRSRLREAGVPEVDLVPSPPETSVAARAAGRDPAAWSAALRQAAANADGADALLAGRRWWRLSRRPRGIGGRGLALLVVVLVAGTGLLMLLFG